MSTNIYYSMSSVYNNFEIGEEVIFGLDETYKTKEVENKFNIRLWK